MEEQRSSNTVDAAVSSMKTEIAGLHLLLEAADRRYEQRFDLQEKAVTVALASQEKAVSAALAAMEKAVLVAEGNSEKWRSNANEWRGAMDDREERMVMKEHLNPVINGLQKEVDELKTVSQISIGRGEGMDKLWKYIVAGLGSGGVIVAAQKLMG